MAVAALLAMAAAMAAAATVLAKAAAVAGWLEWVGAEMAMQAVARAAVWAAESVRLRTKLVAVRSPLFLIRHPLLAAGW